MACGRQCEQCEQSLVQAVSAAVQRQWGGGTYIHRKHSTYAYLRNVAVIPVATLGEGTCLSALRRSMAHAEPALVTQPGFDGLRLACKHGK
jgi:hypothetical protein